MNETNIYYSPEKFGLKIIAAVNTADSYEFNIFLVLVDKKGKVYYSTDSGCSCPTPFEDLTKDQLKTVNENNYEAFKKALVNHNEISKQDIEKIEFEVKKYIR